MTSNSEVQAARNCFSSEFGAETVVKGVNLLRLKALNGELHKFPLRSLCWKVFLGVLSATGTTHDWVAQHREFRGEYEALVKKHIIDPHKVELDPNQDNPLAHSTDSPWQQFFDASSINQEIQKDVERLYPEYSFFRQDDVRKIISEVLLVYSLEHQAVSYRQGMHELVAALVFTLYKEHQILKCPEEDVFGQIHAHSFIAHDAYALFCQIMKTVGQYYAPVPKGENPEDSPLMKKAEHVQNTLLRKYDSGLHRHLTNMKIEPQMYMMRWVRLVFGREFHLEDVLRLWDAIFADSVDLELLDFIAVAMLIYIRGQLLEMDYSQCMRRLFKFPPVEDVFMFVTHSLRLRTGGSIPMDPTPHPLAPSPQSTTPQKSHKLGRLGKKRDPPTRTESAPVVVPPLSRPQASVPELNKVSAQFIDGAVEALQDELLQDGKTPDMELCLYVVAELKRVRDALRGQISLTDLSHSSLLARYLEDRKKVQAAAPSAPHQTPMAPVAAPAPAEEKPMTAPVPVAATGTVVVASSSICNLHVDADEFGSDYEDPAPQPPSQPKKTHERKASATPSSIFESDDEDDLLAEFTPKSSRKVMKPVTKAGGAAKGNGPL